MADTSIRALAERTTSTGVEYVPVSVAGAAPAQRMSPTNLIKNIFVAIGTLWQRAKSQSLNNVNWRMIVGQNPFVGSGVGGENYANEVVAVGWNLSETVGVADTPGTPAFWDNWEYKYNIAGKYYHERHMESVDTSGNIHRVFSYVMPHDGGSGSALLQRIDSIQWDTFDATGKIQWNLASNIANFGSAATAFKLRFVKNDAAPFLQRNAAGDAYIDLPYYNASNQLVFTGSQVHNVGAISAGNVGRAAYFNNGQIANGSFVDATYCGTQTSAEFYARYVEGTTSSGYGIRTGVRNLGTGAFACADLVSDSTGAAFSRWTDYINDWSAGKNQSGNWFLGRGNPGTNTVATVDKTTLQMAFEVAPRLKNLATYANDAAAGVGGLTTGHVYQTSVGVLMVKL